jgi:hypothetical protein
LPLPALAAATIKPKLQFIVMDNKNNNDNKKLQFRNKFCRLRPRRPPVKLTDGEDAN